MYRLILFIKRVYVLLLFIILEATALHFYSNSTNYTQAKLLTISNSAVGGLFATFSDVTSYFGLKQENQRLAEEIVTLRNQLETAANQNPVTSADSVMIAGDSVNEYYYMTANVINNSISRQDNLITLDKGWRDGVESGMAIATIDGAIVGYILQSSNKFSVAMSMLNSSFRSSGRIRTTEWYGPVFWDGTSYQHIMLTDIPKYATIQRGDTIVTTNYSSIFPPNMKVGTVESFQLNESLLYDVKVRVFAPMASLNKVMIIKYSDAEERDQLEAEAHSMNNRIN